jgi:hypothetical protein
MSMIDDAAERAVRAIREPDSPLASTAPGSSSTALAKSTFVFALAQLSDRGVIIRRVAEWKSLDPDQHELLEQFLYWRLVVRRGETVEVSHEAIFKEWKRLKDWLEIERTNLEMLKSLEGDASTWERKGRDSLFLNHRGRRLTEATALVRMPDYAKRLGRQGFGYLAACQNEERLAHSRMSRTRTLAGASAIIIVLGLLSWLNEQYIHEQWNWFAVTRPYMTKYVRPYALSEDVEKTLKAGMSFRECAKDCPEMIVIRAGKFIMGSPPAERNCPALC